MNEYLFTILLEPANRPFAQAKIAGIEMCWSHNRQYHAPRTLLDAARLGAFGWHGHARLQARLEHSCHPYFSSCGK